ncbi:hypothetical protein NC797_08505 [Aquibacillus sp. 3ASR75-11]|uniref:Uncharacterized protein n=1 Tax=Terrihalobacillus insolitus TaxID=2950438 RepID=A0A9X3WRR3_9BACI|nr:hypothetical protein [Terrihalobacillus insolitus]MDC3413803.1 hypothetical protein [Terrihalobacillus insolitus]MDC3424550.1 hypothetical protein [Terrihalobacillus insolitus]
MAKECQSRHYDALVSHTTIVFTRYIMLALSSWEEKDPKTIRQLFYLCCDEMEDIRFAQALMMVIDVLKSTLSKEPVLSEEKVQSIIDELFDSLPQFLKRTFLDDDEFKAQAA